VILAATAVGVGLLAASVGLHDLLEGERLLPDLWDEWKLSRQSLASADAAWAANPRRSDVVISLTTVPSRLPLIGPTLKSLMRQSVAPARIILNLPAHNLREGRPYPRSQVPTGLQSVEIHPCADLGPLTKLLPTITRFPPGQLVLVVDDDRIYHATVLADLIAAAQSLAGAAVGHSGWRIPADLVDRPATVCANLMMQPPATVRATRLRRPYRVDVLQGLSGYLVRGEQFDIAAMAELAAAPPEARWVDDVWIAGHRRAPAFVVPAGLANYPPLIGHRRRNATRLGLLNRGAGGNAARHNSIVMQALADRWPDQRNSDR
jgi:hypothetical protein